MRCIIVECGAECGRYQSLCKLAGGIDCRDTVSSQKYAVPEVDGYDVWNYVIGTSSTSPRTEIMVSRCEVPTQHNIPLSKESPDCSGAYISGDFKLVVGMQFYGFWQGPVYPNITTNHSVFDRHVDCGLGCVFDIRSDPGETNDLAQINPGLLAKLRAQFLKMNATQWNVPVCPKDPEACQAYVAANDGFFGPYLEQGFE